MGRVAERAVAAITWARTAERYLEVCQRFVSHHPTGENATMDRQPKPLNGILG
jgi:hypothetical protein